MSERIVSSGSGSAPGLLGSHVETFVVRLRGAGYARNTLQRKRSVAQSFVRWTCLMELATGEINESHLAAYLDDCPPHSKARVALDSAAARQFLRHLRLEGVVPWPTVAIEVSPAEALVDSYVDYLRGEKGLAENSINVYAPYVRDFLCEQHTRCGSDDLAGDLDAPTVHAFVIEHIQGRSSDYARLLGVALRSFLRFLYVRERTAMDLSFAVPSVRRWRQATVPAFLSPEQVEQVLSATDPAMPSGRRDYAVLLLLARLGLRASEVVAMELADIRWRSGEMMVRGKGGMRDRLPLLSDVGEALASYLHEGRGRSRSKRVFLRTWAPRVGLSGPASVGHIVRTALARAGVRRSGRGAAHLFRHSLATRMIRHGASIQDISEVLRHRSQDSTEIYAKVAFESLREVARPWPGTGGAR